MRVLLVTLIACAFALPVHAKYGGGSGTADDPYRIATATQLIAFGQTQEDYDKHVVLTADIDLDPQLHGGKVFNEAVIGTDHPGFSGVFDGNGHTISHLTIEGSGNLGLFGILERTAEVMNLGIVDVSINGWGHRIGALAGDNDGTIIRTYSTGLVRGVSLVGGLVGMNWSHGTVTQCYSTGEVYGGQFAASHYVGGLVGDNQGTVTHCYNMALVSGGSYVGGLVGVNAGFNPTILTSYSTGIVTGVGTDIGGLVGARERLFGLVGTSCFWDVQTSGQAVSAGGTGLTTVQMQTAETFLEWGICDGDGVWTIDEGNDYPRLRWEGRPGQPIETELSDLLEGQGTPEQPYLIYTLEDINIIALFPCEQDKQFRLAFLAGEGTEEAPYLIETADQIELLCQCPYETEAQYRLRFLAGEGTEEDPYIVLSADDINLLVRCPYERDKHFRLAFLAGSGTQETPYAISNADQLSLMAKCPFAWDAHFVLTADIDLSGYDGKDGRPAFDMIGKSFWTDENGWLVEIPFTGVFDGNGYAISHLNVTERDSYVGLFREVGAGGQVRDVAVVDVNVAGDLMVGGLAGSSLGSIVHCSSSGTVAGTTLSARDASYEIGGLVGRNEGDLVDCRSMSVVSGTYDVGGLVGHNAGVVLGCSGTGTSSGVSTVGGLVGTNESLPAIVACCYSTVAVSGVSVVGGLVGSNFGTVTQCYSAGAVSGTDEYVGGLVGYHDDYGAHLTSSFWDTQTSGQTVSEGGQGLTTSQMQDINTFLQAGWDLADEMHNGTCDYWEISPGEYPRLRYRGDERPLMPEGLGTADEPYLIHDAQDLGAVWLEPLAHYRLAESVDLSGITWSMAVVPWFRGSFDGNGYIISNLNIRGVGFLGLFGQLYSPASLSSLALETVDVNGTSDCVGGLAGANYGGNIAMSYSMGSVSGTSNVGGLVGHMTQGEITYSYSACTVVGGDSIGGLVGANSETSWWFIYVGGSILDCYSTGAVSGYEAVGGLVGSSGGSMVRCYSTGLVSGESNVGGLMGHRLPSRSDVADCFWDIETSGQATNDGGTGKTTAEMQMQSTFTDVGWDFVDETENGTDDIWWILEGQDYPRLWWEWLGD